MKIQAPLIVASLLLLPRVDAWAGDLKTIPAETVKNMKKGKKLNLVWKATDFDGSKGCMLGRLSNESDDEAAFVLASFPEPLKPILRAESPYTLNLAVVSVKSSSRANGYSNARVEVEGQVIDKGGALVAAFDTVAASTNGGNERDDMRLDAREIAFQIAKELFTASVPTPVKPPAVIVAAPNLQPPAPVPPPQPVPQAPAPSPAVQAEPAPAPQAPLPEVQPATPSIPVPPPLPQTSASIQPKPNVVVPVLQTPLSTPLPASITANMKKGSAFSKLWISPAYDRSLGFSIGEVRYLVDTRNPGISGYLPDALAGIAKQDAPYALHLGIVELTTRLSSNGRNSGANFGVEGRLVARDGTVVAAFRTRESVTGTGDITDDCHTAAKKVILAISKELR